MKKKELILGIIFLICGVFFCIGTMKIKLHFQTELSAKFIPGILSFICIVVGISQCIHGVAYLRTSQQGFEKKDDGKQGLYSVLLLLVMIFVYTYLLSRVGFLVDSSIMLFLLMILLSPENQRNYLMFAAISVVSTVIIYYTFRIGLDLMLPRGILG